MTMMSVDAYNNNDVDDEDDNNSDYNWRRILKIVIYGYEEWRKALSTDEKVWREGNFNFKSPLRVKPTHSNPNR